MTVGMKRSMTRENDFSQSKRSRNGTTSYDDALAEGKYELRVLIPSKSAGAVIGKGGSFIKDIRSKFDANVTVPDKQTPERVLTITCGQDNIVECFAEIYNKLAEDRGEDEVRMLIHDSHAGAVIGRGGSKIKELREQTKAQLKVFKECCPNSTDRLLVINVQQEHMPDAIKEIINFLKEIPVKGTSRQYDSSNYDPDLNYGGHIDKNYKFTGGGRNGNRNMAPFDSYRSGPPPQYGGSLMGGGGYGGGVGRGGILPPLGYMQDNISTTQVTIPNDLGGIIIGKGGERINQIRDDSGAKIEIGTSPTGLDERIITITGVPHQIQMAEYLLQQSVRTSEAGRRYLREQR